RPSRGACGSGRVGSAMGTRQCRDGARCARAGPTAPRRRRGPPMSPVIRSHLTPRYPLDPARLAIHQPRHPDDPWRTADGLHFLTAGLRASVRWPEGGSGRSTKWLASRAANVVSIEHDKAWADRVAEQVASLRHVSVRLVDIDDIEGYADPQNAA